MQTYSNDGVRQERTGWRDAEISERHRHWGFDCPAIDIDFLMIEYNHGYPVAIVEYKHWKAKEINIAHPSMRAMIALANGYKNGLPCFVAIYVPDYWIFQVRTLNEHAERFFQDREVLTELTYVQRLYAIRKQSFPELLRVNLRNQLA